MAVRKEELDGVDHESTLKVCICRSISGKITAQDCDFQIVVVLDRGQTQAGARRVLLWVAGGKAEVGENAKAAELFKQFHGAPARALSVIEYSTGCFVEITIDGGVAMAAMALIPTSSRPKSTSWARAAASLPAPRS